MKKETRFMWLATDPVEGFEALFSDFQDAHDFATSGGYFLGLPLKLYKWKN